ncbi:MAG: coproporphyrinogen III oxidase family protein [Bacteroidetes bacterium]|uniref:Coproporphyrinogen III oxidase family protein n=1 Tax=Candidatus Cryptobacteroides merdavium TaxID=2840769 RepID=A0A9D9EGA3_9BACT|nr:coproporphyrinogen III oxidase family protein [Candidatus Cryptobacteroides merdavium]
MIYVHVPFCRSFCTYCGFYSEKTSVCHGKASGSTESSFIRALCSEIGHRKDEISVSGGPDTLYIGGGTPSVLPLSALETIVETLDSVGGRRQEEFTVEVNPEDIVEKGPEYARGLLRLGVNRVSMGVQSLDDRVLRWMNRRHDAASARKAYAILREAGFINVSVDLISGISFLDDDTWLATVDEVLSGMGTGVAPEHISSYQLSVEPDSALAGMVESGRYSEAPDDKCERQYYILCRRLAEAGYHHYEISNFAIPGLEARHNSAYWRHLPYVGLGPAAHSFSVKSAQLGKKFPESGAGCLGNLSAGMAVHPADTGNGGFICGRSWNSPSLEDYLAASATGDFHSVTGWEILTVEQVMLERIMLSLRTDSGIEEQVLRDFCRPGTVDAALASDVLVRCPEPAASHLRIPEDRFFVSDNIIGELV